MNKVRVKGNKEKEDFLKERRKRIRILEEKIENKDIPFW